MRTLLLIAMMALLVGCNAPGDEKVYEGFDWDFAKSDTDTVATADNDTAYPDTVSDGDAAVEDKDDVFADEDPDADGSADTTVSDGDQGFGGTHVMQWGTSQYDTGHGIGVMSTGQFYVTGETNGVMSDELSPGGNGDIFLTRHDVNGTILWTIQLGTEEYDVGYDVAAGLSGEAYVTGETYEDLSGEEPGSGRDAFLTKVKTNGDIEWIKQWGENAGDERGSAVVIDGMSGDILVVGYTDYVEEELNGQDAFLLRYDGSGTLLKYVRWGTAEREEATDVAVATDGSVYVVGYTEGDLEGQTLKGLSDIFVTKFDADGNPLWTRLVGTDDAEASGSVAVAEDGSVYVAGATYGDFEGNDIGDLNPFLVKLTPAGDLSWVKRWGGTSSEGNIQVAVNSDGDIFVAGQTFGDMEGKVNKGADDIFVTKWSPDGTKGKTTLLGTDVNEHVFGMAIGADDAVLVTGETFGELEAPKYGGFDIFVAQFLKSGF